MGPDADAHRRVCVCILFRIKEDEERGKGSWTWASKGVGSENNSSLVFFVVFFLSPGVAPRLLCVRVNSSNWLFILVTRWVIRELQTLAL